MNFNEVLKFAPDVRFHSNENFFPCSIEHLLQSSVLLDRNNPSWSLQNLTQQTLEQYSAANYYISINPSQFNGDLATAPMYYAVQEYADVTEVSYIMLYSYQGGQTCRALRAGTEFNCIVNTLGIHQGDIERVVLRLKPNGSTYTVLQVGYEAHGDVTFYPSQRVQWNGTHPVINVALNGHSVHNMFVTGDVVTEYEQPGAVAVISALGNDGTCWQPYLTSNLKQLGLDGNGTPINDQLWAKFSGRIGISQTNSFDSATYFNGSNLSGLDSAFVKIIGWAAITLDRLDHTLLEGNGPIGPGERNWVTAPAPGTRLFGNEIITLQANDNMGEGPSAVAYLPVDFDGDGKAEIVQCWANGSSLGMVMYGIDDNGTLAERWEATDMGEGPGALAWLTGNFYDNNTQQFVQCWDNGNLGMFLWGYDGNKGIKQLWYSENMGEGPAALAWLTGDFNGDGKTEIVQCWDNGNLGLIMYGSDGKNGLTKVWDYANMGQGPGAVKWLTGDFNNDGKTEIIQCWANGSSLGMIMYGSNGAGGLTTLWGCENMQAGPNAVQWLIGDFNNDGKTEIVQCWANGSSLGMIMYGWNGSAITQLWSNTNMGQGPNAVAWFAGNYVGNGACEIIQCWANGSSLGMISYGSDGSSGITQLWASDNMGDGPGAVAWLTANFNGGNTNEIIQFWNNNNALGMIMYGTAASEANVTLAASRTQETVA